jgi:hypothetical protein
MEKSKNTKFLLVKNILKNNEKIIINLYVLVNLLSFVIC